MKFVPAAALFLFGVGACESVTSERIEAWKGTQKGPDKIESALRNGNVPAPLRAEAAVALVDIGKPEKVDEIMASLEAGQRWEILKTLIGIEIKGLSSPQVPKARDARDTLFSVRQYAPADEQKRIDTALLGAIEKDLVEGRYSGGRHSLDKMLTAIGPPAGPMLVRLLGDPKAPYRGLAELFVKVCDEATRDKGGAALLGRIPAGKPIPNDMWLALGILGGPTVSEFLSSKMQKGTAEEAIAAAKALQQSRFPSLLGLALKIAGDPRANKELREEAFGIVEKVGGPEALKGLLRIIAEDRNDIVRYRAHEAALEVGKADAILPALQAFSDKLSFKREDVVDFLVKDISKVGPKAKPAVLAALASPSPLARMTAILALAAPLPSNMMGTLGGLPNPPAMVRAGQSPAATHANARTRLGAAEDAAALDKLADDKATLKGFPRGMTVGAEAKRVATLLQGKGGS